MESEYINPSFQNYTVTKTPEDYTYMNRELAPEGANVESLEDDYIKSLLEQEESAPNRVLTIQKIDESYRKEKDKKMLYGMTCAIFTMGLCVGLLANRDLTSSITDLINGNTIVGIKDVISTFTPANYIAISGSAISLAGYIKSKNRANAKKEELENQRINFLKVNEATDESFGRRLR